MGEGTKAVAQWVEFTTSGQEVVGSIPAPGARSLWLDRCQFNVTRSRQKSWFLRSISVWQQVKLSDVSLRTHRRYSLVADEDVMEPTNHQPSKQSMCQKGVPSILHSRNISPSLCHSDTNLRR